MTCNVTLQNHTQFGRLGTLIVAMIGAISMIISPVQSAPDLTKTETALKNIEGDLENFITNIQTQLDVLPGVGVAIVLGDQVLLSKGYGIADLNAQTPFTARTYSYIASGTKAIVGLAIATLADRGELDLDAPIGPTYLGDMEQDKLGLMANVTLRQLLTHTHGINGDSVGFRTAYTGDFPADDVWDMLRGVQAADTGTAFDYSNFGYVAAGYVLEHIYGETWQNIVERVVLAPADMDETVPYVSDLLGKPIAHPHQWMGTTQQTPIYKTDKTMHAAGGQYTTAGDMAKWLELNINEGRLNDTRVLPAAAVTLTQAPLATLDAQYYDFKRNSYGLGWYDSDYEGTRLLHHFGAYTGYRAHISIMPSLQLGVAVLSNDLSPPTVNLPDMIATFVYDLALGKDGATEKYAAKINALKERMAPYAGKTMPARPRNTPKNEQEYAGQFENDLWGVWDIRQDGEFLRFHWGQASSDITYTVREDILYLRIEIAGNGYLVRPKRDENGELTGLVFHGALFTKRGST